MRRATDVGGGFGCLLPFHPKYLQNIRLVRQPRMVSNWFFRYALFCAYMEAGFGTIGGWPLCRGFGCDAYSGRLSAFSQLFGSARFTHLTPITVSTPKSLPDLLEELNHNLAAVDTTTEAICRVMVRRWAANEVPVPLDKLAKLCGLLQMVRDCVVEMEERL